MLSYLESGTDRTSFPNGCKPEEGAHDMTQMQRRKFLTTVAGAAATAPFIAKAKTKTSGDLPPIPEVILGNTGNTTSRMAQGTGFKGT